jgi:hypothetical protein
VTGSLFDPPPYARDSETSRAAAREIEPHADTMRAAVLEAIRKRGEYGATRAELVTALGMPVNSVTPRVWELVRAGLAYETSATRLTPSGRRAAVLRAGAPWRFCAAWSCCSPGNGAAVVWVDSRTPK